MVTNQIGFVFNDADVIAPELIGKTAVWIIRVYGPAKFAARTAPIAFISGNSAFTDGGRQLRLIDMVPTPDAVVGGGSWAVSA